MIFIDTGPWLARFLPSDSRFSTGRAEWRRLERGADRLATSSLVVAEALTLLRRRAHGSLPGDAARCLYASENLTLLRPTLEDEMEALDFFEKYADQELSFTDSVSFALMRRNGIKRAFTFDRDFRLAGFEVIP